MMAWIGIRPLAMSWPPERRAAEANGAAQRFSKMSTPAVLPGSIAAASQPGRVRREGCPSSRLLHSLAVLVLPVEVWPQLPGVRGAPLRRAHGGGINRALGTAERKGDGARRGALRPADV